MSGKTDLQLDWVKHDAAAFACKYWHYSGSVPAGAINRIGAWEGKTFIGVVLFSRGATQNLLKPYSLKQSEGCELTRVALRQHHTQVSRIVAIAIRMLRKRNPGLRLVVSFADPYQSHHGGIYQAGNWVYAGKTSGGKQYIGPDGKIWHSRMISKDGLQRCYGKTIKVFRKDQCVSFLVPGKHRYLMPLDSEMRKQIEPLMQEYPKREKQAMVGPTNTAAVQRRPSRSNSIDQQ